ncbi:pilus assembly protein [Cellvibrio fibrivorans]|jgi:type IV pilus assembly protein PilY1|uniref:Type IV pilus assembly protein PilY1 n=1 Tax=Cellvibrio fibrivorans TaxID=126350 RepID=A0ABU1V1A8_9GAMM|nr:PilC/PilY family type IV pilus protein [Cellvibrio fibrivorans]MDR7091133.1 type IV pilus assembly protein PilY1 [Cellvibrio fibrivorans]
MSIQHYVAKCCDIAGYLPLRKINISLLVGVLSIAIAHSAHAAPSQDPLFLSNPVVPIMMLNMSKDHQLYYKIYDDYSDLDGGGEDTTYKNSYDYYGYFDSEKCYTYNTTSNRFVPSRLVDNNGYCNYTGGSSEWSGNFLNWSSMTRVDSIRKILYGGLRSTDSATVTVLERAFLPHDAHSFAKFYNGTDLGKLTPFGDTATVPVGLTGVKETGITICNTTPGGSALSQNVTNAPLLRVAKGNYTFWASNERWQCRWNSEVSAPNGNASAVTGVFSYTDTPVNANKLGTGSASGEFYARVEVCKSGLEESNCYLYPSGNKKPEGLLQKYGEIRDGSSVAKINFGLLTGSYSKNKSGGILRKAIGNMSAEINATTNGTFTNADGAIKTLNSLRPYGYRYSDGTYFGATGSDNCSWGLGSFSNADCSNWGNPQAEIFLESLRYLAGKSANADYVETNTAKNDASRIAGLTEASWTPAPVTSANYCAPLNVLQFNASTTSYDGDNLGAAADIGVTVNDWTNKIADASHENLTGNFFIGSNGTNADELCTKKPITSLSAVRGTCPDAPRLQGSYQIAGLAHYARTNDLIPTAVKGTQSVRTYGVALSPALPKVTIDVPNGSGKKVTILPACRNKSISPESNCAIVDFKILSQSTDKTSGTLYVNWEDSEQGGDYDQDMWGVIKYAVTATTVSVTTDVVAQSTPNVMGFGYVISGTTNDGFHVHSGINGYSAYECSNCTSGNAENLKSYTVGNDGGSLLESPLYYAAKWGGYSDAFVDEVKEAKGTAYTDADLLAAIKTAKPESYYYATDPRQLEKSLEDAFRDVAKATGSASAVATNSTRLSEGSYVFQAQFNSENWTGELNVFEFDDEGNLPAAPVGTTEDANSMPKSGSGRTVYTINAAGNLGTFNWASLTTAQKDLLKLTGDTGYTQAEKRADWLLGNATYETDIDKLRKRGTGTKRVILGDIVNSSPAYVGAQDFRYNRLPVGGSSYSDFVKLKKAKKPRVFVGSNDGAVHAFETPADKAKTKTFVELFAYIPGIAFPKLALTAQADYGSKANPHQFIVDGPITVGDVFIGGNWRTIIVGTLGAGGRGVYALDVTDPTPKVLWELSAADYPQLGYVLGKPLIVPMKNDRWAVVFGNGSSSGSTSSLFVVDIEAPKNPSYTKILDAGVGTGLSAPALLPNVIGQVEVAYAGDLSGNLWRFNLFGTSASDWKKDYLLFAATDKNGAGGNAQPISAAPTLGLNALKNDNVMVYFGTGKYFEAGDNTAAATPVHSFYAIADVGRTVARTSLFKKELDTTYTPNSRKVKQDVALPVQSPDWAINNGWYLDFGDTPGERVTTKSLLLQDWLIFPTLIPSGFACEYGGRSWLMAVKAVGDRSNGNPPPINSVLNEFLVLGDVGFGQLGEAGKGAIIGSGTDATLLNIEAEYDAGTEGRQSWRQVQ